MPNFRSFIIMLLAALFALIGVCVAVATVSLTAIFIPVSVHAALATIVIAAIIGGLFGATMK